MQSVICVLSVILTLALIPPDEILPSTIDARDADSALTPLIREHPSIGLPRSSAENTNARSYVGGNDGQAKRRNSGGQTGVVGTLSEISED